MWRNRVLPAVCVLLGFALAGEPAAGGALEPISVNPAPAAMVSGKPGAGMFLVATRSLYDPNFGQSVVYLVEHNDAGTMGLIVNRSSGISLSEALPEIEDPRAADYALHFGGPVGRSMLFMLVRSESATDAMAHIADDVYISTDRRVLDDLVAAKKPASELRIYIGHSGWAAGQLDSEIEYDGWHVVAADTDVIFSGESDSLWERLIEQLEPIGIQVDNRPALPGHRESRVQYIRGQFTYFAVQNK